MSQALPLLFSRPNTDNPSVTFSIVGRFSRNIVEAGWLGLVILTPLYFNPFSQGVFENHKIALLRAVTLLMVAAWAVYRLDAGSDGQRWWRHPVAIPLLLFGASQLFSTAFSIAPLQSLWGLPARQGGLATILCYLALFLMVARLAGKSAQLERLVDFSIYASLPVSLYALAQYAGVDPVNWGGGSSYRVTSTLGNPVFLSAYLTMVFLPTLGRLVQIAAISASAPAASLLRHWRGSGLVLLLLLQFSAIWLSYSRGPLLALLVALVAIAIIRYRRKRQGASLSLSWSTLGSMLLSVAGSVGIGLLLVFALGLMSVPALPGAGIWIWGPMVLLPIAVWLSARRLVRGGGFVRPVGLYIVAMTLVFGVGFDLDRSADVGSEEVTAADLFAFGSMGENARRSIGRIASVRERLWYWQGYRDAFLDGERLTRIPLELGESAGTDPWQPWRFWIGYGQEQGDILFQRHYPLSLARYHPPSETLDRAHNSVWDLLLANGVVGLVAFCWLLQHLFAQGLHALGYAMHRPGRKRLALLFWSGAFCGGAAATLVFGAHTLGVGIVVGIVGAVLVQLLTGDLRPGGGSRGQNPRYWVVVGLFAAMLSHVAEGAVSFGVASTDLLFWLFAGLLASRAVSAGSAIRTRGREAEGPTSPSWTVAAVAIGLPLGVLVFDFLLLPPTVSFSGPESALVLAPAGSLFADGVGSAWVMGASADRLSFFYVGLMGLSWLWLLSGTIRISVPQSSGPLHDLGRIAAGSLAVVGLALMLIVWNQQQLAAAQHVIVPDHISDTVAAIVRQTDILELRVGYFYLWTLAVLLALAGCLLPTHSSAEPSPAGFTVFSAVFLFILWVLIVVPVCFKSVRSDMAQRASVSWRHGDTAQLLRGTTLFRYLSPAASLALAERSVRLAPGIAEHWVALADNASSGSGDAIERLERDSGQLHLPTSRQRQWGAFIGDTSDVARNALQRAQALRPFDPMLTRHHAVLALRRGGPNAQGEVQSWLEMAGKVMNGHPEISNDLAHIRLRVLGDPEGSLAILDGVLESPEAPVSSHWLRVEALSSVYDRDCRKMDSRHPTGNGVGATERPSREICQQRLENVVKTLAHLVDLEPKKGRATAGLFRILFGAGRRAEAFRVLAAGLTRVPESVVLSSILGGLAGDQELRAEVTTLLESVIKARPTSILPRIVLARAYADSDRGAAAVEVLDGIAAKGELSAAEQREIASLYLRLDRPYDGFQLIQRILRRWPADAPTWSLAARVLSKSGNGGESAKALEQVVRWAPEKSLALDYLNKLESRYLSLGMVEQAATAKRRARVLTALE